MKSKFPGYYRPTNEEFADMWQKCIFVLDTNNLLDFYRFSDETVKQYFDLLEKISDRLWIPYQIALEYQRNRLEVIIEQASVYEKLSKIFGQTIESVDKTINSLGRHAASKTDIQALNSRIKKYLQKIIADLDASYNDSLNRLTNEEIHNRLVDLFEGRVGEPYELKKAQEIYSSGSDRYDKNTPPGYKDKDKKEDVEKYGDLILWLQIIDYAKVEQKPIVFITNDTKEDWWEIRKGRTIGPRPELRQEMRAEANVDFYIYTSEEFLRYAQLNLEIEVTEAAIEEVKELKEETVVTQEDPFLPQISINEQFNENPALLREIERAQRDIKKMTQVSPIEAMQEWIHASQALASQHENPALLREIERVQRDIKKMTQVLASQRIPDDIMRQWEMEGQMRKQALSNSSISAHKTDEKLVEETRDSEFSNNDLEEDS